MHCKVLDLSERLLIMGNQRGGHRGLYIDMSFLLMHESTCPCYHAMLDPHP